MLGLQHVAGAGDDVELGAVGDDQHRLEVAQVLVGAPVLGELDRGALSWPGAASSFFSSRSSRVKASAVEPAKPQRTGWPPGVMRRTLRAVPLMTVWPRLTWPSPATTTLPPLRTAHDRRAVPARKTFFAHVPSSAPRRIYGLAVPWLGFQGPGRPSPAARAARCGRSSLGAGLLEVEAAAVAADELGGDDEAEAGAALADAAAEGLEQVLARPQRQAGTGVEHPDFAAAVGLARPDRDAARAPSASIACAALRTRLVSTRKSWSASARTRIASARSRPRRPPRERLALVLEHLGTSGASAKTDGSGGSSSALPKASVRSQRVIARDSEADELRRARATAGSALVSIRSARDLGRGQHVAQVVADLRDRAAEAGEPLLLPQGPGQPDLEVVQRVSASRIRGRRSPAR